MAEDSSSAVSDQWSVNKAITGVTEFMRGIGLPRMARPTGMADQYEFPTSVLTLTSAELGQLSLQLTSWYTYLLGVIGDQDAELGAIESVYEISLGVKMQELQSEYDRRIVKEALRALAIKQDSRLDGLTKSLIQKRMLVKRLETQAAVYHEQLLRLSREQSRRESEARTP